MHGRVKFDNVEVKSEGLTLTFDHEMAAQTQRFLKDAHAEDRTIDEILILPRWQRVYLWWLALDYYGTKPFPRDMTIDMIRSIYGND